ncbi:MAG: hypothetical protein ACJAYU_001792 [Bradymonadia bacterium]|jgi:hypothetical protein
MRNLKFLMSVLVAGGALAGCDTEETIVCTSDAECGGYLCEIADGATDGVCQSACSGTVGCATGFACGGGETGTECVATTATCADLECGSYLCDATAVACYDNCTAETVATDCVDGAQCDVDGDVGTCAVVGELPFMYIAVVSRAEGDAALNNANPGPDLDFISVSAGGIETGATGVVSSNQGLSGDEANTRPLSSNADAVTSQDTVVGGVCDLDAQPGYVAIGGTGGFITVQFGRELATGDTVTVYEVDSNYCSDAATERPDAYEVYVTNDADAAMAAGTAASIQSNWCLIGAQGGNGGVGAFQLNLDACAQ